MFSCGWNIYGCGHCHRCPCVVVVFAVFVVAALITIVLLLLCDVNFMSEIYHFLGESYPHHRNITGNA